MNKEMLNSKASKLGELGTHEDINIGAAVDGFELLDNQRRASTLLGFK